MGIPVDLRGLTESENHAWLRIESVPEVLWSDILTIRAALSRLSPAETVEPIVYCVHGRLGLGYTTDRDTIEGLVQKLAWMHGDDADDYTATPLYAHPPAATPIQLASALSDLADEIAGDEPSGELAELALAQARAGAPK